MQAAPLIALVLLGAAGAAVPAASASYWPTSPCINGIAGTQCSLTVEDCRAAVGTYTPQDRVYAWVHCSPTPIGDCHVGAATDLSQQLNCGPARGP